jgi:hypothetical protein
VIAQESLDVLDKKDIPYYGIHISNEQSISLNISEKYNLLFSRFRSQQTLPGICQSFIRLAA